MDENLKNKQLPSASVVKGEQEPDIPVYDNVGQVKRKKSFGKWVLGMFFGGMTPKEIIKNVVENDIVPGIKDNTRNSIVRVVDMALYENGKSPSSSKSTTSTTNYVSYYNKQADQKKALEDAKKKEREIIDNGFSNPAFHDKATADRFLNDLKEYVKKYEFISVHTLYTMRRMKIDYTWDKYIWEMEEILAIKGPTHINNPDWPWMIDLPQPHVDTN